MNFSLMFFASLATGDAQRHYQLLLDAARIADRQGFAGIWTPERHFDEFGGVFPNPVVTNAALAAVTKNIQLRAGSVISPLHDALLIAEDWSMIDNLSGGRAAVSFGSGWNPNDFALAPAQYGGRKDLMWEQIDTVHALWRGQRIRRTNGVGGQVEVELTPRPVQPQLPVWITTGGTAETFVRAGAAGANLLTHMITQDFAELAELIGQYRQARRSAGHDPETGCVTVMLHTFVGADADHARAVAAAPLRHYLGSALQLDIKAAAASADGDGYDDDILDELLDLRVERYFDGVGLLGDIDQCVDVAGRFAEIGVDDIACLVDFGVDAHEALGSIERLATVKDRCSAAAR